MAVVADAQAASASELLRLHSARPEPASPKEAAALLGRLAPLRPSAHDERLRSLVAEVLERRRDLPLAALVDAAGATRRLGLREEMTRLMDLALDNTSFLPGDAVLALAKTLALAAHRPGAGDASHAAVFRILGEHVQEALYEAEPAELAEALLALAVFHCSARGGAPDPALARPLHLEVFAAAGGLLLGGRAAAAPPAMVAKCLRAYTLLLLGRPPVAPALAHGGLAAGVGEAAPELVPPALAEALAPRLGELTARDVVRCLHAVTSLHAQGLVPLEARGAGLCNAAMRELGHRVDELGAVDLTYALRGLAVVARARGEGVDAVSPELLRGVYSQVQQHVPSLTLDHALSMARSAARLRGVARPGVVAELLAAEVVRELRTLQPQQVCDAAVAFARLRHTDEALQGGLRHAFSSKLDAFLPRQLATTLHSLVKSGLTDERIFEAVAVQFVRDFVGFRPRDVALTAWCFATTTLRSIPVFSTVQRDIRERRSAEMAPADISMLLWSFAHVEWQIDNEVLSNLAHRVAKDCSGYPRETLVVCCLSFARLGFAQQPVLVELYRSMYARLPELSDSQLAFSFFLFSTSGVRDEPLLRRFLFESAQRLQRLRGQDLSNVLLACSRSVTPQVLADQPQGLGDLLWRRIFEQLHQLEAGPLLGVYLVAPQLFTVSQEEGLQIMDALAPHLPHMDAAELSRCLFATGRLQVAHKPFLLPLFHHLRKRREGISAAEAVSCVWAVDVLGFCKPKFRRTLGYILAERARERLVPARSLAAVLPALSSLGLWERLPLGLRRSVWHLASEDLRRGTSPPPPRGPAPEAPQAKPWRLPLLRKGALQPTGRMLNRIHGLQELRPSFRERRQASKEDQRDLAEERPPQDGPAAVADFVKLVQRL